MKASFRHHCAKRSAVTAQCLVLIGSLNFLAHVALDTSVDRLGQNISTNPAQYAVIDLGTNATKPIKVTDSGYVLSVAAGQASVWKNGTSLQLQLSSVLGNKWLGSATDIGEDGTVVGLELCEVSQTNYDYGLYAYGSGSGYYFDNASRNYVLTALAAWAPGSQSYGVTIPRLGQAGDSAGYAGAAWNSFYSPGAIRAPYRPMIGSTSIWAVQVGNPAGHKGILDGFNSSGELGTSQAAVYPLAVNASGQSVTESDSGFTLGTEGLEGNPWWSYPQSISFTMNGGSNPLPAGFIPNQWCPIFESMMACKSLF